MLDTMTRITTHPGEVLREEFMKPLGLTASALARDLDVPVNRITGIIADTDPRSVTPDTALRLEQHFGMDAQFWLNLQTEYDLTKAIAEKGELIKQRVRVRTPSAA
ncbi:HigA family addiction module antitoxin [Acidisphaera sp. S103]|uniref:HigA family addiction module antitoxin n=1 Tax=Acidisphaera sp. S103 TaxID=1747223 RepID=UPI0020B17345|nr:HigA family addiction module antitoxin [Acidisphaera sp. S103]